jgi:hypothetical protein
MKIEFRSVLMSAILYLLGMVSLFNPIKVNAQIASYVPVDSLVSWWPFDASGEIPFHIYSITGVKVMDGSVKSEKTINTAYLNAGVYVIDAGGMKVKFIKK